MILKGIKKEGRIRIYLMSGAMIVFGGAVFDLPKLWMKLLGFLVLSGIYLYTTTHVAKEFRYAQQKDKGGKKT